jgi:hypothetical protein
MYTDPFGLCPDSLKGTAGGCPDEGRAANGHSNGEAVFDGVVLNLIVGTGPTVAVGTYTNTSGAGWYLRLGIGVGLDVGVGGEHGGATAGAFAGGGEAICGGAVFTGGCLGGNGSGGTVLSMGPSVGPTEFAANGHTEVTHTWVTKPRSGLVRSSTMQCGLSVVAGLGPSACR